jgi:hypothetical protein
VGECVSLCVCECECVCARVHEDKMPWVITASKSVPLNTDEREDAMNRRGKRRREKH